MKLLLVSAAVVIGIAAAGTALAVSNNEPWYVVFGTPGNDTINESANANNYRIYGFEGKNTLTGGKGDSVVVGNGQCPKGTGDGSSVQTIPPPAGDPENNADQYCSIDWITGQPGDVLKGSDGKSAPDSSGVSGLVGGYGNNTITGGTSGDNAIEDGPSTDTIQGGPDNDVIDATNGPSTVTTGSGGSLVDVQGNFTSTVYCHGNDYVYADTQDHLYNCPHVYYPSHGTRHVSWSQAVSSKKFNKHLSKKAKKELEKALSF
jgi:Ca2+-binding RTX toxin-like protein